MEQLMSEKQSYQDYVEGLNLEKEEMIRSHTIETGELRKKVGVLTDHVHRLESAAISTSVAGSNAFHGGYGDMDTMSMANGWDQVGYLNDFPVESEMKQEPPMPVPVLRKSDMSFASDVDKSATQGGLLFMLFLVGAFVLSSRSTPSIPAVSDDVRAASATLLENVLKDAGVGPSQTELSVAPQASAPAWGEVAAMTLNDPAVATSMLGQMGDSLTRPTREQANEQLFSLSAAQYNGVSSQDFLHNAPERSTSQGRRNLAEALAAMRNSNKQSAAEVYTRSLLWDQIPGDVVRNFAKMVAESNRAQNEQQQCASART
jgi:hypothetical protein